MDHPQFKDMLSLGKTLLFSPPPRPLPGHVAVLHNPGLSWPHSSFRFHATAQTISYIISLVVNWVIRILLLIFCSTRRFRLLSCFCVRKHLILPSRRQPTLYDHYPAYFPASLYYLPNGLDWTTRIINTKIKQDSFELPCYCSSK